MKNLVLIVHANVQDDLADLLRAMDKVPGFTFSHVEGHGAHVAQDPFLSAHDKVVGYTPRVRVDILLKDEDLNVVIQTLTTTENGLKGHGIYWVNSVEQDGRL
ncbi:MAG: DUF3240 family protein [Gammaproteobacteria bacterium]|nr:DUF3240 family protein [Gammaproteobacteria bacterium]